MTQRAPRSDKEVRRTLPAELLDLGISYRQLNYWCTRGYLLPGQESPGSGNCRQWTRQEIAVAAAMVDLVRDGFRPDVAAERARAYVGAGVAA